MNKKISHIVLIAFAGMALLAMVITKSGFSIEKFKQVTYFQAHLDDQSENQVRTFSPVWHSITRRFLP